MKDNFQPINFDYIKNILIKYERYFVYLGWTVFAIVGLLQMMKFKGGFITNYGADIIAPLVLYYSTRINKTILSKIVKKGLNALQTFILIWVLCIIWELSQKLELAGTVLFMAKGTFDYWDIITYTLTLLVCYYVDVYKINPKE